MPWILLHRIALDWKILHYISCRHSLSSMHRLVSFCWISLHYGMLKNVEISRSFTGPDSRDIVKLKEKIPSEFIPVQSSGPSNRTHSSQISHGSPDKPPFALHVTTYPWTSLWPSVSISINFYSWCVIFMRVPRIPCKMIPVTLDEGFKEMEQILKETDFYSTVRYQPCLNSRFSMN